jgi:hypothetical protein
MVLAKTALLILIASDQVACSANNSGDADQVAKQMLTCLNLPANPPEKFEMDAVVTLKNGQTGMVAINFLEPPTEWEKTATPAVADAITNCAPYGNISGRVTIPVTSALIKSLSKK